MWKVGRAVEGTGLENRQGRKFLVSSNLTPSASPRLADSLVHRVLPMKIVLKHPRWSTEILLSFGGRFVGQLFEGVFSWHERLIGSRRAGSRLRNGLDITPTGEGSISK